MRPLMYGELVPWYRLIDPPADHAGEAACYRTALERAANGPAETLLELGSGAGHNALFLKERFRCTLTDLSDAMLDLSRALNPECEHAPGDMRTVRLDRTFDTVLVHDAVMYMTSREDLLAAVQTAFVHTRPGGAALFAPDCIRETFRESTNLLEAGDAWRELRGIEWSWDPDPGDDTFVTEYGLLLREGETVTAVHDRHVEGVFSRSDWFALLQAAGFHVETTSRPLAEPGATDEVFLCCRPR